jgi:hypothetical protein
MRKILCFLIFCGGLFNAHATTLVDCDAARDLQTKFLKFDASDQDPHYIWSMYLKYEHAWSIMERLAKVSKTANNRHKQFGCLVGLAAAAGPWDGEGRAVGLLADSLNDQTLKTVYETELAHFPDQCRADSLRELPCTQAADIGVPSAGNAGFVVSLGFLIERKQLSASRRCDRRQSPPDNHATGASETQRAFRLKP